MRAPVHSISMLGCWDVLDAWDAGTCGMGGMLGRVGWVGCWDVWNEWDARTCEVSA